MLWSLAISRCLKTKTSTSAEPNAADRGFVGIDRKIRPRQKVATFSSTRIVARVSTYLARVEHYARQNDGHWVLSDAAGPEATIRLAALEAGLLLSEVYARVEFAE